MKLGAIHILEKDPNKKGDLFGRLMSDFFHSIGYGEPRLNVAKPGREIDLRATHRVEKKIALAECKAVKDPIGGDDVNKFVGAVDVEIKNTKKDRLLKRHSVEAYFLSLSGFKESAIEQEEGIDNSRVILVGPDKIVEEFIKGKIIVSIEEAVSKQELQKELDVHNSFDLIAHSKGWILVLYYSAKGNLSPTHFALVHPEGNPLVKDIAAEIVNEDSGSQNIFNGLALLNNKQRAGNDFDDTRERYFNYLKAELGEIQFEGMPTDKEDGTVRVKLESIFTPLHLIEALEEDRRDIQRDQKRQSIGEILHTKNRLAILAKPGGGKSTLIKRIAIAYAFPDRREQINDGLPDRPWFPIFLRCRELGEKVTLSITDIIHSIPARAEIPNYMIGFASLVSSSLQNGNALLLIDGLDEIADDRARIAFINQLRTFIATYPTINIIVTSREAGFRVVGGSLSAYCSHYRVSPLIESEIEELTLKWHRAIIDNSDATLRESKKLSDMINNDTRIGVLAQNPLMLTTLLFVKRWAGYIPTKRTVLYQEMIKLLLVTWNVEGHERLDIEEAEPQLAFIAYWMTMNGRQNITEEELKSILVDSRKQMPEILGYTTVTPGEFIRRVELRSSILIMSGHNRLESGEIVQVYEFLHLSFQEYLTAKAIVNSYIPASEAKKKPDALLKRYMDNMAWKEVIPIAAVMLGRDAKGLIEKLIETVKAYAISSVKSDNAGGGEFYLGQLLGNCLANEVQISPALLENAIEWYAKSDLGGNKYVTELIVRSKFGSIFSVNLRKLFFERFEDIYLYRVGSLISDTYFFEGWLTNIDFITRIRQTLISAKTNEEKSMAVLGFMDCALVTTLWSLMAMSLKTYTPKCLPS